MRCIRFDAMMVVVVFVAVLLPAHSESSPITFERAYGGPGVDWGESVQQTTDGGYIVTGPYDLSDSGPAYLVKTDAHGDTLWTRTFGGAQRSATGASARQTADGGYIFVANADSGGSSPGGIWFMKTDAGGDTLWTRTYAGDVAEMVEQTADGGYVITGNTSYLGPDGADVLLMKTDSSGDLKWRKTWGGTGDDVGNSVQQTTDGGYVIAANTMSFGVGVQDIWLVKTDSVGDTLWTRTFGGSGYDYAGSAQQTLDGGYFVAGATTTPSDSPKVYLIKTDASGDTSWTRMIGGSIWPAGYAGGLTRDGGFIIVGFCQAAGPPDVYLVRTDSNGDTLWTRSFGGPSLDMGYQVQQTADGGYVVCGETYSFGAGEADFYLIKTDENGNLAVAEPKSSPFSKSVLSLGCEPNPFRSSTILHLTTGPLGRSTTHLRVYDAQGRLVRTLAVNQASQIMWDGSDDAGRLLPSGTYLVRCEVAGRHATARLVLQR